MRATIQQLTITDVQIDLPDACPKCGADFTSNRASALIEDQLIGTHQNSRIADGEIRTGGTYENDTDPWLTLGFHCSQCDWLTTEAPAPDRATVPNSAAPLCPETFKACAVGCRGWDWFNEHEIQRCDECRRFDSDDAAMAHVQGCNACGAYLTAQGGSLICRGAFGWDWFTLCASGDPGCFHGQCDTCTDSVCFGPDGLPPCPPHKCSHAEHER